MRPVRPLFAILLVAVTAGHATPASAAPPAPRLRPAFAQASRPGASHASGTGSIVATPAPRSDGAAPMRSVPDGAGGTYFAWSNSCDGTQDLLLIRVTAGGAPAAGWPASGVAVCTAPGDQGAVGLFPDGANGVLVVWMDGRAGIDRLDLYAQRVNTSGVPQWASNGVLLGVNQDYNARVCPDGTGGLLAVWGVGEDSGSNIVGNRLTAAGTNAAGWNANGTPLCSAPQYQSPQGVLSDGTGGGYFLWRDVRSGNQELWGQHVNAAGVAQWTADGIVLATGEFGIEPLAACEDGAGGLIAAWAGGPGLVVQRFDGTGAELWTAGGRTLLTGGAAYQMTLLPVGSGNTLAVWSDFAGPDMDIHAQRVDATGASQWDTSGVVVRSVAAGGGVYDLHATGDGLGGVIVTWVDGRDDPVDWWPSYTQRISSAGVAQWAANGLLLSAPGALADQIQPTADGSGGALFAWADYSEYDPSVRAQRLNASGAPQLAAGGVRVTPGATSVQRGGLTVHDGANGAWIVWVEQFGTSQQLRARHLGPTGSPVGATVVLSDAPGDKYGFGAIADGSGGLIAGWTIYLQGTDGGLYAQRVDAAGTPRWTPNGVVVSGPGAYHNNPQLVPDGAGGALFAWSAYTTDYDVLAQRVDATGALRWGANGLAVCTVTSQQYLGALVSDGAGGMLCAWADYRQPSNNAVYAQRVNAAGVAQWTADGTPISTNGATSAFPRGMVGDGAKGAIVLIDAQYRPIPTSNVTEDSLRLQRVDSTGTTRWGAIGTTVFSQGTVLNGVQMVSDGLAGAVVAWEEERTGTLDLYAQRVNDAGAIQWAATGAPLCVAADWQQLAGLAGDGAGGVFASWADARGHGWYDLYAQHLLANGSAAWTVDGIVVGGAARGQYGGGLATDATGGVIVGWTDNRNGIASNVVAQRVQANGAVRWAVDGVTSALVSLASATLDGGRARLAWYVGTTGPVRIERATESSAWAPVATRSPDGDGMVRFEDASVQNGVRTGWRLSVPDADGDVIAGEVWLGGAVALALEAPSPNPVQRDFTLAFTLPVVAPARLELFDVRGRRVASRDVGALGAGHHVARFDDAAREPGVYFARLTQGATTRQTRVVVVR